MSEQSLANRIEATLAAHGVPPEVRGPLKVDLIRQFAQQQIEAAQGWVQLATEPDLATLPIRELKARAQAAGVAGYWNLKKRELVEVLAQQNH